MKLIIAGSRNFNDYNLLKNEINNLKYNITEIVSGTAKGADTMGEKYATEYNIKLTKFPAEWNTYGKKAGMIRNKVMGDYSDVCIAFWDSYSKGTKQMIDYMKKLKKPCIVVKYNDLDNLDDEW